MTLAVEEDPYGNEQFKVLFNQELKVCITPSATELGQVPRFPFWHSVYNIRASIGTGMRKAAEVQMLRNRDDARSDRKAQAAVNRLDV